MNTLTLALPRNQRPFSAESVLSYYDGPLIFWLPWPGRKLLAIALPDEAGPYPFLVLETTEDRALAFESGQLSAKELYLAAQDAWLLPDYGADVLVLEPLKSVPDNWL